MGICVSHLPGHQLAEGDADTAIMFVSLVMCLDCCSGIAILFYFSPGVLVMKG